MKSLPKLPEIDGLRSVAVIAVVLNHLGISWFSGGYVGVDIFFVISGFLITNIIKNEVEITGAFDYNTFYLKRFRRLFPAFFVVALTSFSAAFAVFGPRHFMEFCASTAAALASVSNIFFWAQVRYFDTASHLKPMLHTWSLSVEEQFYVVWPFLVVFLAKGKIKPLLILMVLGMVSLALNYVFLGGWVQPFLLRISQGAISADGGSTIFYLMPFRIFEFAIGASLVWMPGRRQSGSLMSEAYVAVGIALIAYSIVCFDKNTVFPSFNALIPCLGTALIIYGGSANLFTRPIKNPVASFFGKISYSIYLVHWPIIVFTSYILMDEMDVWIKVCVILLTLVLAWALFTFVEDPIRAGKRHAVFMVGMVACSLTLAAASFHAWYNFGWMWRYPENVANQLSPLREDAVNSFVHALKNSSNGSFARDGLPRVMIVGDSMSGDFINLLHASGVDKNFDLRTFPLPFPCLPVPATLPSTIRSAVPSYSDLCVGEAANFKQAIIEREPEMVVLAAMWASWWLPEMDKTIEFLRENGVKKISIVGLKSVSVNGQQVSCAKCASPANFVH